MLTLVAHTPKEQTSSGQDLWVRKNVVRNRPFYHGALYEEGPHMLKVDSVNEQPKTNPYPMVLFQPIAEAVLDDLILKYGWESSIRS